MIKTNNGLDRTNPDIGYIKSNVVSCCRTCNKMKARFGYDEFIKHITRMGKHLSSKLNT